MGLLGSDACSSRSHTRRNVWTAWHNHQDKRRNEKFERDYKDVIAKQKEEQRRDWEEKLERARVRVQPAADVARSENDHQGGKSHLL